MEPKVYDTVLKAAHDAAARLSEVGQEISALRYEPGGSIPDYRDVKAAYDKYDRCHEEFVSALKRLMELPRE